MYFLVRPKRISELILHLSKISGDKTLFFLVPKQKTKKKCKRPHHCTKVRFYLFYLIRNLVTYSITSPITIIPYMAWVPCGPCDKLYTANVNSRITDKLKYLLVVSKQTNLFLDIFESCYNHRQMPVKIKIKSHIQQKNWENFVSMKKAS